MNVFDLVAKITLDKSGYEESLDSASKNTDSFAEKLKSGLSTAAKIGTTAIASVATTAVATGKTLFNQASATSQYGDRVDKMSQKIGLSTEAFQKWDYVMQLANVDISGLQVGMKTFSSVFVEAANGSETAAAKLTAVGLSVEELNGLSQEQQLELVINRLQQMEAGAERTAAATDLLGRSAIEMAPLLNMTAEETNAAMKEAEEYGMVLSDTAVKDAATFQDSLTKLSSTFTGLKNKIFADFMPGISAIVDGLSDLIAGNDDAVDKLSNGLNTVLNNITNKIPEILGIFENIFNVIVETIMKNLPAITKAATNIILTLTKGILKQLPTIVQAGVDIIAELINGITESLPDIINCIMDVIELLVEVITNEENLNKLLNAAVELMMGFINGIIEAIPRIVAVLPTLINRILSFIIDSIPLIIDAGVKLLVSLVAALPEIIDAIVEALPSIIDGIVEGLMSHIGEIIDAGVQLMASLFSASQRISMVILEKIPDIITGIVKGFMEAIPHLWEVGKQMLSGLWQGIKDNAAKFWKNLKDWLGSIWDGIKEFFGIASPSKEMKWVGKMLVDGLSDSIDQNGSDAVNSALRLSENVNNALSGIGEDINIPLQDVQFEPKLGLNSQLYDEYVSSDRSSLQQREQNLTIVLELDRTQLGKVVYQLNNEQTQRVGVKLST